VKNARDEGGAGLFRVCRWKLYACIWSICYEGLAAFIGIISGITLYLLHLRAFKGQIFNTIRCHCVWFGFHFTDE
jgi:hypothetical protein